MVCSARLVLTTLVVASFALTVEASMFLEKVPMHARVSEHDVNHEKNLLSLMEDALAGEHRIYTEKRLDTLQHSLMRIMEAVPKNENGKLGHAAVSYVLYRFFVQRHAWFIIGLEPFKAMAEWNSTSPTSIIEQRTPAYISGLFNARLSEHGFGVHEVAVLAATLEHLVRKESLSRLSLAYQSVGFSTNDVLSIEEGHQVMDTYMTIYTLGGIIQNISNESMEVIRYLRANTEEVYPTFPETQRFMRETLESMEFEHDFLYYSDLASLVEEVGDRYGRWQDYECRELKDMLLDIEEGGTGGEGRVRLAHFYKAALEDGKWQFSESIEYLRSLGALDESDPYNLRVIIPNYINGPSNCVASSTYYSVCCINECEEILSHVEIKIGAPEAMPTDIKRIVAELPSSTTTASRTLSPWLVHRLSEVAEHHGGLVPLHGRLFAQWLHYAYPRECMYPHVIGATSPKTSDELVREGMGVFAASETDMKHIMELPVPSRKSAEEADDMEGILKLQSAMWTMEEELVVVRSSVEPSAKASLMASVNPWLRPFAFAVAVASAVFSLVRTMGRELSGGPEVIEKYYV